MKLNRLVSVAPMMQCTDRHFRFFIRAITRHALLSTEMLTSSSLLYGDAHFLLQFSEIEHPIAVQLGGSDPLELARCAKLAAESSLV